MKIRLTAYSYRILLLLLVSITCTSTDAKTFKENSCFDSRPSEAREFINHETPSDQDNLNEIEHKNDKNHFLLFRLLNHNPTGIQRNLNNEALSQHLLLKDARSRDICNHSRTEHDNDVDADIRYVAVITTTASIISQRMLDALTAVPLAIRDAYQNKRIERKWKKTLEPEFDHIGCGLDRKQHKADLLKHDNAVYSFAAIPVVAGIAEGVAVVAAAIITNAPAQPEIRPEQQAQDQVKNQTVQQPKADVVPVEPTKKVVQAPPSQAISKTAEKAVQGSVQSDKGHAGVQETITKDVVLLPADVAVTTQKNAQPAQCAAVRAHEDQRAYDRKVRDDVVDTAICVGATLLQQYDQRQKLLRKQERLEACIQERMKSENKSRWQIEEEIRRCQEQYEQERQAQKEKEQKKKYSEDQKRKKHKSDQLDNNRSRKDNDPDQDPEHDPKKGALAAGAAGTKRAKDSSDKAHKKGSRSQEHRKPTPEEIRRAQCRENAYTNGKGVHESNPKHHPNASGKIAKEPARPVEALKDSLYVDGDTRVAIQDREIVVFRRHGTTVDGFPIYHSYIENNINRVDGARKVLVDAGLIHPKNAKVLKK